MFILYSTLYGCNKLSWDKNYGDNDLEIVTQTNVILGVNFPNEKELKKIKYSTNCGEIKSNGLEIDWNLNDAIGDCEIVAQYKLQKIKKKYNVIPFELDKDLVLDFKIDLESEEDLDSDGVTNKQEFEFKTNPLLADSDMDGLDDYYELFVSKTNPNNKDTDNDGLNDYDEVQLGLNPLVSSTYNDGIKDGDRELNFTLEVNGIKIEITGKGNIASTIIEVDNSTKISKKMV